jgi:hypothetical protein
MIVTTTKGLGPCDCLLDPNNPYHHCVDASSLEKREGEVDDDNEHTTWTEYWLDGELVHRSVHVHLKKAVLAMGEAASFD